jgi:hypothetical protein
MWRDSAASRAESSAPRAATVAGFLGKGATDADRSAIELTLRTLADARGDWVTGGLSYGPTGPAGYARAAVTDPTKLDAALKGLLAIEKMAGAKARLADAKIGVTQGKAVIPGVDGDVLRVKLERKDAKDGKDTKSAKDAKAAPANNPAKVSAAPSSIEILFKSGKEELVVAAGYDAREALRSITAGKEKLGGAEPIARAVDALGGDVAFTLVIEPLLLLASAAGKPSAGESAPVLLALGRDGTKKEIWGRLELSNAAVRELLKRGF